MLKRVAGCCALICLLALASVSASSRDIRSAIEDHGDGYVRMTFAARDGVCGNGWNSISMNGSNISFHSHHDDDDDRWREDCDEGPVRVLMKVRDGEIYKLKTRVGGKWRNTDDDDLDLGMIASEEAADFFLSLAEDGRGPVAEDAILPAILARDVVVWRRLLKIARRDNRPTDVRESAVFWLGQLAGEKATEGLVALVDDDDEDLEVREAAVFALSQCEGRRNTRRLVEIARTNPHPQIRKQALFWLADRDDPEVLDIFEEILLDD